MTPDGVVANAAARDRERQARLDTLKAQLEAEEAADLTFRPKISPFAQRWAKSRDETDVVQRLSKQPKRVVKGCGGIPAAQAPLRGKAAEEAAEREAEEARNRIAAHARQYMKKHADLAAERTAFVRAHGGVGPALFAEAQVRQQRQRQREADADANAKAASLRSTPGAATLRVVPCSVQGKPVKTEPLPPSTAGSVASSLSAGSGPSSPTTISARYLHLSCPRQRSAKALTRAQIEAAARQSKLSPSSKAARAKSVARRQAEAMQAVKQRHQAAASMRAKVPDIGAAPPPLPFTATGPHSLTAQSQPHKQAVSAADAAAHAASMQAKWQASQQRLEGTRQAAAAASPDGCTFAPHINALPAYLREAPRSSRRQSGGGTLDQGPAGGDEGAPRQLLAPHPAGWQAAVQRSSKGLQERARSRAREAIASGMLLRGSPAAALPSAQHDAFPQHKAVAVRPVRHLADDADDLAQLYMTQVYGGGGARAPVPGPAAATASEAEEEQADPPSPSEGTPPGGELEGKAAGSAAGPGSWQALLQLAMQDGGGS